MTMREETEASVLDEVHAELARARRKFPGAQNSAHEGYAVLAEEVDELWDEVKANHPDRKARMRAESIQVAAMAFRFVEDVCDR
jgi:molybdopterin biosynthesis enzyme